jgi:GNAT superfamily N-acetyltransferase
MRVRRQVHVREFTCAGTLQRPPVTLRRCSHSRSFDRSAKKIDLGPPCYGVKATPQSCARNQNNNYALRASKLDSMKAQHRIEVKIDPPAAEISRLEQCLRSYNASQVGDFGRWSLLLTLVDANSDFAGGLFGKISSGWLFVDTLWVAEQIRGHGQGRDLLRAAEEEARKRGCQNAWVDTYSPQARSFYERNGYVVFAELPDYPPGHTRYFLKRSLA